MKKGDLITFGNYNWLILHVTEDSALIITEDIIEVSWYHKAFTPITWANCYLREYLNNEFYNKFNPNDKVRILEKINKNTNNQWFKTRGCEDTIDSIFLLSIEEVCELFGNSMVNLRSKGEQRWFINDENNEKRQAKYNGDFHWWRLRSPGYYNRTSASVSANGYVYIRGNGVHGRPKDGGGMRPALWLKL